MADVGRSAVRLEGVHALAQRVVPRRPRPSAAAGWRAVHQAVRDTGVGVVAVHKGLAGSHASRSTSARPPRPARCPLPRLPLELAQELPRSPYDPEGNGVDRLVRSVTGAGIGSGANVYAELGSTWRIVMGDPDAAAHVLGKLLTAFGPGASCGERTRSGTGRRRTRSPGSRVRDHAGVPGAVRLSGVDTRDQATDHVGQRSDLFGITVPAPAARPAPAPAGSARQPRARAEYFTTS